MGASKKRWVKALAFLLLGVASIFALRFLAAGLGEKDEEVPVPRRIDGREEPAGEGASAHGTLENPAPGKTTRETDAPGSPSSPEPPGGGSRAPMDPVLRGAIERKEEGRLLLFRMNLRNKAAALLEEAHGLLAPAHEKLREEQARAGPDVIEGMLRPPASKKNQALRALIRPDVSQRILGSRLLFHVAETRLLLGEALGRSTEAGGYHLKKAYELFEALIWEAENWMLGWFAFLYQARCLIEMGEYGKAYDRCGLVLSLPELKDSPFRKRRDRLVINAFAFGVELLVRARKYDRAVSQAAELERLFPGCIEPGSPDPIAARRAILEKAKAYAGWKKMGKAVEEVNRVIAMGGSTAALGRALLHSWSIACPPPAGENPLDLFQRERQADRKAWEEPFDPDPWRIREKLVPFFGNRRDRGASGAESRTAVARALDWLARHQNPDGMWSCGKFMMNCKMGTCTGPGSSGDYDTGVTGLTLLAFLGAGNTHRVGPHREVVLKGIRALLKRQTPDGCYGPKVASGHWIYGHVFAAQAVAEDFGWAGGTPIMKRPAQRGVDFIVDCQNPYLGWRYGRQTGENDTSVTACAVLALKAAKLCGLHVPKESFDGCLNWFRKVTDEASFETGYWAKGQPAPRLAESEGRFPPQPSMTAAAVTSRIFILESKAADRPETLGGANVVSYRPPVWDVEGGMVDMVYWYWGTLALHQVGGSAWEPWRAAVEQALLDSQVAEGCGAGSWDPVGAWGAAGGRVYATAMCALILET
ncbi:MAG: prenyltransferase/squalene oxidase repeat-containing protein, partial [Planctomycetota bacterium]